MPKPPSAYDLHQQSRWLRHDAHLWIRHDAWRWVKPGYDPAEIYPTLARKPDPAKAAALDAERAAVIAEGYRLQAVLRAEVDELKAALARQRLEEANTARTSRASRSEIPAAGSGPASAAASASRQRGPSRSRWATSMSATSPA